MRQTHEQNKNSSENRINGRDDDLRAHDRREARIKPAKACCDLIATRGIKVLRRRMGTPIQFEARVKEYADSHNNADEQKRELRSRTPGDLGDAAKIMHLGFDRVGSEFL